MRLEDLIGRRLGRYEITALIGRGGMAAVYKARDTVLLREIALKVLYPQFGVDPTLITRFQREAITAARLDHPGIVPIYDVGEADGLVYIAMKLMTSHTLADVLRERQTLSLQELLPIIEQLAAALDAAHAQQVVHRDIKPGNILIDHDGRIALTDFGIAKSLDMPGVTNSGVLIGTPDYMAPEQISNRPITPRTDVYALGGLVYRALTGHRPFEGGVEEVLIGHLRGTFRDPSEVNPQLPRVIDPIIRAALARDPEQRYPSAGAFAAALRSIVAAAQAPTVRTPLLPPTPPNSRPDDPTLRGPDAPTLPNPAMAQPRPANPAPQPTTVPPAAALPETNRGFGWWLTGLIILLIVVGLIGLIFPLGVSDTVNLPTEPPAPSSTPVLLPSVAATATLTPQPSVTNQPTATTEAPTTLPATALPPTQAPTTVAPATPRPATAVPPTQVPATAVPPTQVPTTALPPTQTPTTALPSDTPTPNVTPTATLTVTPSTTPSPTPCPIELQGGFAKLWQQNEEVRQRLGCPNTSEIGGAASAVEQPFERGSMTFFSPRGFHFVLIGSNSGRWLFFTQDEVDALPDPTPTPGTPTDLLVGGFLKIWANRADIREAIGNPTATISPLTGSAYQGFAGGAMLYSQSGLERGATIYVLANNGGFVRYDDPNR